MPKNNGIIKCGTSALKSHVRYKKHKDLVESKKTSDSFFERKKPLSSSDNIVLQT